MRVIDLSTLSLVGGSGIAEAKIGLWWADGTGFSTNQTSSGTFFASDGNLGGSPSSASHLFTLSSNWQISMKFSLECTMYCNGSNTAYNQLWDFTSNTSAGSQISTASSSIIVIRSGQFSLTPSHVYGLTLWSGSSSSYSEVTDASLIVFPQ